MPVADLDECQWPTEWPGNRDASPYVCPDCYSEEAMTEAAIVCTCPFCNRFFRNCKHNKTRRTQPCHFYQLIFTDGACSSNGLTGATSGIGVAIGNEQSHQWSIPVDDSVDPAAPRTSQRAELLAGIEGIRRMMAMDNDPHMKVATMRHQKDVWIIASDSEYLIKGMVEWMPSWKVRSSFISKFSVSQFFF